MWQEVLRLQKGRLQPFYRKIDYFDMPLPRYDLLVEKKIGDFYRFKGRVPQHLYLFSALPLSGQIYSGEIFRK